MKFDSRTKIRNLKKNRNEITSPIILNILKYLQPLLQSSQALNPGCLITSKIRKTNKFPLIKIVLGVIKSTKSNYKVGNEKNLTKNWEISAKNKLG